MKNLYNAPEAELLKLTLVTEICGASQTDITDTPEDDGSDAFEDEI